MNTPLASQPVPPAPGADFWRTNALGSAMPSTEPPPPRRTVPAGQVAWAMSSLPMLHPLEQSMVGRVAVTTWDAAGPAGPSGPTRLVPDVGQAPPLFGPYSTSAEVSR